VPLFAATSAASSRSRDNSGCNTITGLRAELNSGVPSTTVNGTSVREMDMECSYLFVLMTGSASQFDATDSSNVGFFLTSGGSQ